VRLLRKRTNARSKTDEEGGAAAVEFALVLPIFLLLLLGIVQYGTIFLVRNQMTEAASDAARAGVAAGYSSAQGTANDAVQTDLDNDGAGLIPISCDNAALSCSASVLQTCPKAPTGYECLQVTITYDYAQDPVIPTLPFIPTPSTMTATSTVLISSSGTGST
jgi:Flp pilus assembly protein TadG